MPVDYRVLISQVLTDVANVLEEKWSTLALYTLTAEVRGKPSYCLAFFLASVFFGTFPFDT